MQSPEKKQLWVSVQLQMEPPYQPPPLPSTMLRGHCGRGSRKKNVRARWRGRGAAKKKKKLFLYMLFSQIKLKYYFNKRRNCAECLLTHPHRETPPAQCPSTLTVEHVWNWGCYLHTRHHSAHSSHEASFLTCIFASILLTPISALCVFMSSAGSWATYQCPSSLPPQPSAAISSSARGGPSGTPLPPCCNW